VFRETAYLRCEAYCVDRTAKETCVGMCEVPLTWCFHNRAQREISRQSYRLTSESELGSGGPSRGALTLSMTYIPLQVALLRVVVEEGQDIKSSSDVKCAVTVGTQVQQSRAVPAKTGTTIWGDRLCFELNTSEWYDQKVVVDMLKKRKGYLTKGSKTFGVVNVPMRDLIQVYLEAERELQQSQPGRLPPPVTSRAWHPITPLKPTNSKLGQLCLYIEFEHCGQRPLRGPSEPSSAGADPAATDTHIKPARQAASVMHNMPAGQVVAVLTTMECSKAAIVLASLSPEKAAEVLEGVTEDEMAIAKNILGYVEPAQASVILELVNEARLVELLSMLTLQQVAAMFASMDHSVSATAFNRMGLSKESAAELMARLETQQAAELLSLMEPRGACAILSIMDAPGAVLGAMELEIAMNVLAAALLAQGGAIENLVGALEVPRLAKLVGDMPQEDALQLLNQMEPDKAAAVLSKLPVADAMEALAGTLMPRQSELISLSSAVLTSAMLSSWETAPALEVMEAMPEARLAEVLDLAEMPLVVQVVVRMPVAEAARVLGLMEIERTAQVLSIVEVPLVAELLALLPVKQSATILSRVELENAAEALVRMECHQVALLMNCLDLAHIEELLTWMPEVRGAEVLGHMEPASAAQAIGVMVPCSAADLIGKMPPAAVAAMFQLLHIDKALVILEEMELPRAAEVVAALDDTLAVGLLHKMDEPDMVAQLVQQMQLPGARLFELVELQTRVAVVSALSDPDAARLLAGATLECCAEVFRALPLDAAAHSLPLLDAARMLATVAAMPASQAAAVLSRTGEDVSAGLLNEIGPTPSAVSILECMLSSAPLEQSQSDEAARHHCTADIVTAMEASKSLELVRLLPPVLVASLFNASTRQKEQNEEEALTEDLLGRVTPTPRRSKHAMAAGRLLDGLEAEAAQQALRSMDKELVVEVLSQVADERAAELVGRLPPAELDLLLVRTPAARQPLLKKWVDRVAGGAPAQGAPATPHNTPLPTEKTSADGAGRGAPRNRAPDGPPNTPADEAPSGDGERTASAADVARATSGASRETAERCGHEERLTAADAAAGQAQGPDRGLAQPADRKAPAVAAGAPSAELSDGSASAELSEEEAREAFFEMKFESVSPQRDDQGSIDSPQRDDQGSIDGPQRDDQGTIDGPQRDDRGIGGPQRNDQGTIPPPAG
ncbi:hypothetical protein CYMTET_24166, partial [Cymbomonas tetramitiformis]